MAIDEGLLLAVVQPKAAIPLSANTRHCPHYQPNLHNDLKVAGYEEIFPEQVSAVAQRDRLKEALRFVRRGDTLVVCKPDKLARSTTDLLRIWTTWNAVASV